MDRYIQAFDRSWKKVKFTAILGANFAEKQLVKNGQFGGVFWANVPRN